MKSYFNTLTSLTGKLIDFRVPAIAVAARIVGLTSESAPKFLPIGVRLQAAITTLLIFINLFYASSLSIKMDMQKDIGWPNNYFA